MTWVMSVVIAIVFLVILIGMCVSDEFASIVGIILSLGITLTALTLVVHLLFFE